MAEALENNLYKHKYIWTHEDEDFLVYYYGEYPINKYGFVRVQNPEYQMEKLDAETNSTYYDEREYLLRKPTVAERREIVINTIIELDGKPFAIPKLAQLLSVSDRTIQTLLKKLEQEKIIAVFPRYGKGGERKSNIYRYIGAPCKFYGSGLNLRLLYSRKQDVGFRSWAWPILNFSHNNQWYDFYPICKVKFQRHLARRKYLEENNLPLVVPEPIKYLVLRYSYWKGAKNWRQSFFHEYSDDGTYKISLDDDKHYCIFEFFGRKLLMYKCGTKLNPKVKIYNLLRREKLATFTWFSENVIKQANSLDDSTMEQFFILGDFTTK